jgi:hypothetical protein
MEQSKPKEEHFATCKMCSLLFQLFKITLSIYFVWFLFAVLFSKFPSPGELLDEVKTSIENYNMANLGRKQYP